MFLPAFFAPDRWSTASATVASPLLGAFLLAASAGIALDGQSVTHFLLSSLALGSGRNLMLIAGTTLLGEGHPESERGAAQGLMEQGNSLVAALMSFGSGAPDHQPWLERGEPAGLAGAAGGAGTALAGTANAGRCRAETPARKGGPCGRLFVLRKRLQ